MSAAEEIVELDRALMLDGQDIILRRVTGTTTQTYTDVQCRAFVRGFLPEQIVGSLTQQDSKVILSPTQINAAQWPDGVPAPSDPFTADPRIPSKNRGDVVYIRGKKRTIESAEGIVVDNTLVRINMIVRG